MRSPDIKTAVQIYYTKPEIVTDDIRKLFSVGKSKAQRMKNEVRKVMAEKGVKVWLPYSVNTEVAFEVWGLNITNLEARLKKLQRLGMET